MAGACPPLSATRRAVLGGLGTLTAALLAGCGPTLTGAGTEPDMPAGPSTVPGETLGSGPTRVALLLPSSASGNASLTAGSFRSAAQMALADIGGNLTLLVKDTSGSPDGARAAAQAAIAEGAQLVLGPVFADAVRAAGSVARTAGVPLIGFSTDASVATRGVYLLSFLPETNIERVIAYAAQQGRRSIAAILPQGAYGTVSQAAFQQAAANSGMRVAAIETYSYDRADMQNKAQLIAKSAAGIDAVFVPDGGDAAAVIAQALISGGLDTARVKLLGSGQWDDPRVLGDPAFNGAWFAAPDKSGFDAFAQRFRAAHGGPPPRTATLIYDAVVLAGALANQGALAGVSPYTNQALTNPNGFKGIDGIFRFLPNGLNERGLAVLEIGNGTASVISPAPQSFGAT